MGTISIIAATIMGNRGAEAMLTTVIHRTLERKPDATFNVFSYYPKADINVVTSTSNIRIFSSTPLYLIMVLFPFSLLLAILKTFKLGFLRRFFPKSVTALEQSDVLVDVAGVSFIDGREKFLPFNILTIFPAMLLGVPVLKFSQAIGPLQHLPTRLAARIFLSRCKKIFARGEQTLQYLEQFGFPEGIVDAASDIAFLHQLGYSISTENEGYVHDLEQKLREEKGNQKALIGVCPSSVIASHARKEGWNYPELMYQIIKNLLSKGYSVLLFPNATLKETQEKLRNNDLPVIQSILHYFETRDQSCKNLYSISENINTDSIKRLLVCCDYAVVSRFHAMIASLCLEKPTMVLGWGHKYLEIMDQFGLADYVFDYRNNDVPMILRKVDQLIEGRASIQQQIRAKLPQIKQASQRQIDYLFATCHL